MSRWHKDLGKSMEIVDGKKTLERVGICKEDMGISIKLSLRQAKSMDMTQRPEQELGV